MKKQLLRSLQVIFIFATLIMPGCSSKREVKKSQGMVPDEETAIKIADAIWYAQFGENVRDEKPFVAILENDSIWVVESTFQSKTFWGNPRFGSKARIEIQKKDCKILVCYMGK